MRPFLLKYKKERLFDLIIVSIYFITVFVFLTQFEGSDIKGHNYLLSTYLGSGYFPIPPLYYLLVYLVDMLVRVKYDFVVGSMIVITLFQWWKYRLVYLSFGQANLVFPPNIIFFLTLSFLFLSPIYIPAIDGDLWYLGKFTQTIWHSSTLICSFPFSILLVWRTLEWQKLHRETDLCIIVLLSGLLILVKPSFLFCYIPALPVFIYLQDYKFSRQVGEATVLGIALFSLLMVEKYLIFNWDPGLDILYAENEKSEVVVNPMKVWFYLTDEPLFDFFSSFPLLIVVLLIWKGRVFEYPIFKFSLILLFFALIVFFLFAETGFREFHANFYWQIPIALFLCNLSTIQFVLEKFCEGKKILNSKFICVLIIYCLQSVLGIIFWLRILIDFTHQ